MDILSQSALLVGVTSFALGVSVFARNVRNKLFLSFLLLTTIISFWAVFFFLFKIWGWNSFYRLHLLMNLWIAPAGIHFVQVMIRLREISSNRLFLVSLLLSVLLSGFLFVPFSAKPPYEEYPVLKQLIYFLPAFLVLQILLLLKNDWLRFRNRKTTPLLNHLLLEFSKKSLTYLGGLFVLFTSVMDHVPWLGPVMPCIGNLALTFYLFFISQAITHQRLLNFGAVLSRFLVLLAVAFSITLFYLVMFAWIRDNVPLFFLNSFMMSFVILMLLEPIRSLVGYLTDRLLTQKHRKLKAMLKGAQRELFFLHDPASLFGAILKTVEQALHPNCISLFILGKDGTKFRRVRTSGTPLPGAQPVKEILGNHQILDYLRKLKKRGNLPILLDQILESEIERSASSNQRHYFSLLNQGLKAMGSNILIPLMDGDITLGFVTMFVPCPPEPWGNDWGFMQVIYPYFEQAARSLKMMDIFVRQQEKERLATLGTMAAGLAHEIRNPLGAIKGAAQYLDPSADRPESKFLRIIIDETDRLNRVVSQFLDYSKPSTLDQGVFDLHPLLLRTIESFRSMIIRNANIHYENESENMKIQGSSEQVKQVLINLIQNSIKAIEIKSSASAEPGVVKLAVTRNHADEAVISVEDNGVGIRKENFEKLFIPFFTTSADGTGLGLSICQKIIEAHRGKIEVSSEEGRGARFTVVIPTAKGA